jgi:hypothetical protein
MGTSGTKRRALAVSIVAAIVAIAGGGGVHRARRWLGRARRTHPYGDDDRPGERRCRRLRNTRRAMRFIFHSVLTDASGDTVGA